MDLEKRGIILSVSVAKTRALILAFVFAYVKCLFSQGVAHTFVTWVCFRTGSYHTSKEKYKQTDKCYMKFIYKEKLQ